MKKLKTKKITLVVLASFCFAFVQGQNLEQQLLNELKRTSYTDASYANQWTKIAECEITSAYDDKGGVIEFMGSGSGTATFYYGKIIARFKNQNAAVQPPNYYSLILSDSNLGAENVRAVIINTRIEIYVRIPYNYTTLWFRQTLKANSGHLTTFNNQPFLTSLPGGTVVNCVEGISMQSNGRVGIGTNTPRENLEVAGAIRAAEVKVLVQSAPDFVFEPDYELRPLREVEAFIKENKHLPDIPSGARMEAEGVGLAETNMLLLKKIEELTLYMIGQNEKIEMLEKEIEKIKNK